MAGSKSSELVKASDFGLVALDQDSEVAELMAEALAGESLGLGDLERVKWPTGGDTSFKRVVLGNTEHVESIEGVIVHQRMSRSYWVDPEPKEGQAPDCTSPDAEWGYGSPGDALRAQEPPKGCAVCPMAAFGSAKGPGGVAKPGQACKLSRDFFFITPGAALPLLVSIPPGSLGQAKGYVVELASFGIRYYGVVSKLSLIKATNKTGQAYAEARMSMVGKLDDGSKEAVAKYRENIVPSLAAVRSFETPEAEAAAGAETEAEPAEK